MKKLIVLVILPFLMLEVGLVFADEDWNIKIRTDAGPPTEPFDSTGYLTLENFSISALAEISDVTFNSTISELSFRAEVSAEQGSVDGQNIQIVVPSEIKNFEIFNEKPMLVFVYVDGKGNGYTITPTENGNVLGFYLYEGNHTVSLDITLDPPSIPELSMPILDLILASLFIEALLAAKLYVKLKQRKLARVLRTLASFFV